MPLTEQEARCIGLTCQFLGRMHGSEWKLDRILDDEVHGRPSPEALVSDGAVTAAVEVKRLIGDGQYQTYLESMFSLEKYLVPSCGGYYSLSPPIDFRLPMDRALRRQIKREVNRVAPTLAEGQVGAVLTTQRAHVVLIGKTQPGYIYCCHTSTGSLVQEVSPRLGGAFMLVDEGNWEHSFVTEECKAAFHDALVSACERCLVAGDGSLSWNEEWNLTRGIDDGSKDDGVWLIAVTDARDVTSVFQAVDGTLDKAARKFATTRWADVHVVVLDRAGAMMSLERVSAATATLVQGDIPNVDLVLVTDDDVVEKVWPRA